ncbi:phosphatidylinositol-specific phospholipase C1-like protein [Mangrovibacterium sp.]|uniref:phosphatidylinositol-specific phospholipase C1-like protein n=1 Tax=Mangrovibacterium sp. TaxID=1961364 RepID=UPI0035641941
MKRQIFLTLVVALLASACQKNEVRLNDIQVIGSHNSYKIAIEKPLWDYLCQLDSSKAISLQYGHISIVEQLELGLRNIELDVFFDPMGGHFSNPQGLEIVRQMGAEPMEFDKEQKLAEPGLKMFHIQDVDFRSHHLLFKDGLKAMKKWSDENPDHTPVFVIINTKDQEVQGTRSPLPFDQAALDSLDSEIRTVFSNDDLITPDLVRGRSSSLEEAVLTNGWPKLNEMEGRFLFVLDEKEARINSYLIGHAGLKGRVLFVNSPEGNPEAAFRIVNNPINDFDYIRGLVAKGYLVRTRADAGTKESRTNDYTKFEKAKESGAQIISTDYYIPTSLYQSSFKVSFENNRYERIKTKK